MGAIMLKTLMGMGTKLLLATASSSVIEWTFFHFAGAIVKSTKTPHDDKFLEEVKAAYNK